MTTACQFLVINSGITPIYVLTLAHINFNTRSLRINSLEPYRYRLSFINIRVALRFDVAGSTPSSNEKMAGRVHRAKKRSWILSTSGRSFHCVLRPCSAVLSTK
ncbi:uncharacterized protein PITG_10731 [Phytophthora infestans T30-4]|uniref:Uncharacterized protein n=1 Tax=Phytophthora infestans (strain T30-4) TaxID=403677 RepID=D0NGY5_PHYIT|nr:uncharacterized protein PITG_10731 [Phytophthora infestans T30-4]EEY58624.1 hypothetical protein PITG_10731 [Phytophthora infestans T30-4]|eukprot:XP_002901568.1 hypothetical protein PITG_10731 [Phytophthora infestans T30-4]